MTGALKEQTSITLCIVFKYLQVVFLKDWGMLKVVERFARAKCSDPSCTEVEKRCQLMWQEVNGGRKKKESKLFFLKCFFFSDSLFASWHLIHLIHLIIWSSFVEWTGAGHDHQLITHWDDLCSAGFCKAFHEPHATGTPAGRAHQVRDAERSLFPCHAWFNDLRRGHVLCPVTDMELTQCQYTQYTEYTRYISVSIRIGPVYPTVCDAASTVAVPGSDLQPRLQERASAVQRRSSRGTKLNEVNEMSDEKNRICSWRPWRNLNLD